MTTQKRISPDAYQALREAQPAPRFRSSATAAQLRASIARIVTYDERMVAAAETAGFAVASPA